MCDLKLCIGGTASLLPRETFTFGTSEKARNTSNTATRYEIYPSIKSIKIDNIDKNNCQKNCDIHKIDTFYVIVINSYRFIEQFSDFYR